MILSLWEPGTPDNIKKMVNYALLRDKDNHRALIRAFPTFKLMFIAENKKGWQVFDDVYAYNSVISINVTDHEYQTSAVVLVVRPCVNLIWFEPSSSITYSSMLPSRFDSNATPNPTPNSPPNPHPDLRSHPPGHGNGNRVWSQGKG